MDPVDVLTMSVDVARMIRSAADPEQVLGEACQLVGCPAGDGTEPLSLRGTRLVELAGERRSELHEFLSQRRGPLYLNRPMAASDQAEDADSHEPDPEIEELLEYVESDEAEESALDRLGETACPYSVGSRALVRYIDFENVTLPKVVRGLIDYPLERPVLFSIDLKSDMG